jgi:NAD(P)-dependent dehydrogenase (short-subunit alcohol dehydrogenase family)
MRTAPLAGKCALITGSVRGLGLAAAQRLAASGCHIVLNGLEPADETKAITSDLQRHGVRTLYCCADLREPDAIEAMVLHATKEFGAIDILINNAVVRHLGSIEHFGTEKWDEAIAVNLSAAFHTIRLTVPAMKRNQWGRIINVSVDLRHPRRPESRRLCDDEDGADWTDPRRGARDRGAWNHVQCGLPWDERNAGARGGAESRDGRRRGVTRRSRAAILCR